MLTDTYNSGNVMNFQITALRAVFRAKFHFDCSSQVGNLIPTDHRKMMKVNRTRTDIIDAISKY